MFCSQFVVQNLVPFFLLWKNYNVNPCLCLFIKQREKTEKGGGVLQEFWMYLHYLNEYSKRSMLKAPWYVLLSQCGIEIIPAPKFAFCCPLVTCQLKHYYILKYFTFGWCTHSWRFSVTVTICEKWIENFYSFIYSRVVENCWESHSSNLKRLITIQLWEFSSNL